MLELSAEVDLGPSGREQGGYWKKDEARLAKVVTDCLGGIKQSS